ncbi:MAG: hypothetical protein AAFV53_10985 [Myxococcota bacterium]
MWTRWVFFGVMGCRAGQDRECEAVIALINPASQQMQAVSSLDLSAPEQTRQNMQQMGVRARQVAAEMKRVPLTFDVLQEIAAEVVSNYTRLARVTDDTVDIIDEIARLEAAVTAQSEALQSSVQAFGAACAKSEEKERCQRLLQAVPQDVTVAGALDAYIAKAKGTSFSDARLVTTRNPYLQALSGLNESMGAMGRLEQRAADLHPRMTVIADRESKLVERINIFCGE